MSCYKKSDHPQVIQRVEALGDEVKRLADAGKGDIAYSNEIRHEMMSTYAWHGAPQKAEDILDELIRAVLEDSESGRNTNNGLELNARSMNIVLRAWTDVNNPERAEAILKRMRAYRDRGVPKMAPVGMNYHRVIECWNQSNDPRAGERADGILQLMEEDAKQKTRAHLHIASKGLYLAVMKRLAQSGSGECAESLLRRIQRLFDVAKSDTDVDEFLYREVILAWNLSDSPQAAERSRRLEEEMLERFPNASRNIATTL
jgi:PPR repeat